MMYLWFGFSIVVLIGISLYKEKKESDNYDDSLDILDKRYANGDIMKEEYLEQKETLNSNK